MTDYRLGLFVGYEFGMPAAYPEGRSVLDLGDGKLKVYTLPAITPMGTGVDLTVKF